MASKDYSYYNKGNKIAIVEKEAAQGSGFLAVAHCTISGYSTKATCEAAGGQWIPSSSGNLDTYGTYKSPIESVDQGLEIEYSYAPVYNDDSQGEIDTDTFNRFISWGSHEGNLTLFASGATVGSAGVDISSNFSAGDNILIKGSGRWSGFHKVKSAESPSGATDGGKLILETKYHSPSIKDVIVHFTARSGSTNGYFEGTVAAQKNDIEEFMKKTAHLDNKYIWIESAADNSNNGLFTASHTDTAGRIEILKKWYLDNDTASSAEDTDALAAESADTVFIYGVTQEDITVYKNIELMVDESFDINITRTQANSLIQYIKGRLAEDAGDLERMQFYMREFKRGIEKASSAFKRGMYIAQGFWGMRNAK
tara:strand:- start:14 stop:1117 length:1104 start_codon:yes stop_codon:yes gene_type:complete